MKKLILKKISALFILFIVTYAGALVNPVIAGLSALASLLLIVVLFDLD